MKATAPPRIDVISAAVSVLDELTSTDDEQVEDVFQHTLHSCEPEYQLLVELHRPTPQLRLTLVLDLDPDAMVTGIVVIAATDEARHTLYTEPDSGVPQRIADDHFARTTSQ